MQCLATLESKWAIRQAALCSCTAAAYLLEAEITSCLKPLFAHLTARKVTDTFGKWIQGEMFMAPVAALTDTYLYTAMVCLDNLHLETQHFPPLHTESKAAAQQLQMNQFTEQSSEYLKSDALQLCYSFLHSLDDTPAGGASDTH